MALPLAPLSSLASLAVLAHNLDTRDLPLHLHRDIEQYKRHHGAFNIVWTDFTIESMDKRELSQEEREMGMDSFLTSFAAQVIMKFDVVVDREEYNKWSITNVGPKTSTIHLQEPGQHLHRKTVSSSKNYKAYRIDHLQNGKVMSISTKERTELKRGQVEVVSMVTNSYEVDYSGGLTWVERHERPLERMVTTITARARRTHKFGDLNAFMGDEEFQASVEAKGVSAQLSS